jgi:hypothetical protein
LSYRRFLRPNDRNWTTRDWVQWLREQHVAPSVLPEDAGTCSLCRTPTRVGSQGTPYDFCFNCWNTFSSVLDGFVPICYSLHGGLEGILANAKDTPSDAWLRLPLGALLWTFMEQHLRCVESFYGGEFNLRIAIPSHSSARGGVCHLDAVIKSVRDFSAEWASGVLVKNDDSEAGTRRNEIVPGLFTASPSVKGQRILLFDDTFTTGGTMASAAYALKQADAASVVGLSFGRQLRADYKHSTAFVAALAGRELEIDNCVVHGGRPADPFGSVFHQPG